MEDEAIVVEGLDQVLGVEPAPDRTRRALASLRASSQLWEQAIWYGSIPDSSVGPLLIAVGRLGVVSIDFGRDEQRLVKRLSEHSRAPVLRSQERVAEVVEQLVEYLDGQRREFDLPVDLSAVTAFQREVLKAAITVPAGLVATYGEIAQRIGRPRAARAVGQALAHNPIPIVVPCHRVVAADGSLTGYSGGAGVETKRRLLVLEGAALV